MKSIGFNNLRSATTLPENPRLNGGSANCCSPIERVGTPVLLLLNNQEINFNETVETEAGRTSYQ